ncbi:MAG: HIT family protein [Candidatus Thermoplasmatota archaeon]|nr:HIT family protein [Candidatus Thermoplasmatota archaeon]
MPENCIFCKIVKGEIPSQKVWEDENFLAFLDINPVQQGHVLLIPKAHSDYIFSMDDKQYAEILNRAKALSEPIRKATGAKRIGLGVEGLSVPHVHIHIIPVNNINDIDPCKGKKASQEELAKIADKIRKEIAAAKL